MNGNMIEPLEINKIYYLQSRVHTAYAWIFRFLPYDSDRTKFTGCNYCVSIDNAYNITYKSSHVGFLGYDREIEIIRPANKNEIAIFNRAFGL